MSALTSLTTACHEPGNMMYDIFFVSANGLTPGGSSTIHIYTQTIHRTTQIKQYTEKHKTNNSQNNINQTIHRTTQKKQYIEQHKTNKTQNNPKQTIHRTTQIKKHTEPHKSNNTQNNTNQTIHRTTQIKQYT
jgi:hypothetical protein